MVTLPCASSAGIWGSHAVTQVGQGHFLFGLSPYFSKPKWTKCYVRFKYFIQLSSSALCFIYCSSKGDNSNRISVFAMKKILSLVKNVACSFFCSTPWQSFGHQLFHLSLVIYALLCIAGILLVFVSWIFWCVCGVILTLGNHKCKY